MRAIAVAPLDRLVRDEPRLAAAAKALRGAMPAADVRSSLIRHAERQAIERGRAARREMKDELVAVVQEAVAVDRLVVANREVAGESGCGAGRRLVDGDRLD